MMGLPLFEYVQFMLWFRRAATRLMLGTNSDDRADIYRSAVRDLK
eukprot:gene12787-biopygen16415